jgi:hypothetical protein
MADSPADTPRACIRLDSQGTGTVEVDGHDVSSSVRGLTLIAEAGHLPRLILDLLVFTGEVDGQAQVHIPDDTRATLVALGWTPPPRLVGGTQQQRPDLHKRT